MNKENSHIYIVILILFVFISRFALFLDYNVFLSDDDAGFALAAHDYNILESRPHLPGYFVLIKTISAVDSITNDTFTSMKLLVILFSVLSALVIFKLFEFHFNGKNSFWLSILLFSNPLIWFYQCTPESYIYDLFFSSLIALLYFKRSSYFYFLPLISLMGGIRMSSAFFLIPLYFYITYIYAKEGRLSTKTMAIANGLGLVITALWLLPLLQTVGGFAAYFKLYDTHNPMPAIGPLKNVVGFVSYAITIFIPFYPLLISLVRKKNVKWLNVDKSSVFHLFWIIPALLFFMFGHYSKGYVYLIYPALIIVYGIIYHKNILNLKLLYITIVLQMGFFLLYPYTDVNPDTFFRRSVREASITEVFWNRLNNGYLHTSSRLQNRDEYNISLDKCVKFLSNNYDEFIIFDGKSSLMTINSEVYRFPDITFVTQKNFFRADEYILQKGLKLEFKYGLQELYKEVFILCDIDLVIYYQGLTELVYRNEIHALIKVIPGKEKEFKEFYEDLYTK